MTTSETKIINGLTYVVSDRIGKCGASEGNKKLYFPFFLMGCCGDDRGVISWNGERERLTAPKKMDYKWFEKIAKKLKENPYFDWDWCSFSENILKPNREHIKSALDINDEKVDRLLRDGYVFINHFDDYADEETPEDVDHYPNFKNFMKYDDLEY